MKEKMEEGSSSSSSSTSSKEEKRRLKNERAAERRAKRHEEISLLQKIPYSDHERWWTFDTIAVVTGANRGIGFAIAHQLATHGVTVVLTSRNAAHGEEAAKVLLERGLNVVSHQLDIVDHSSINTFAEWLRQTYGGLDILVNNAGINFNVGFENSVKYADKVIETNYYGTKNMVKAMIPLMRPSPYGARIVNVSSRLGRLNGRRNRIKDIDLRTHLDDTKTLHEQLIDHTMSKFLKEVNDCTWESGGWPVVATDYSMSKLAVNAYTRLLSKDHSNRPEGHKIYVNCYCPGWVKTAMTGWAGHSTPDQGADTGVWLALHSRCAVVAHSEVTIL